MEAIINFPEDEVNAADREALFKQIKSACKKVEQLLATSNQGKILKEGIKVVLCGKPNVGKSSLLNVLLKQPRAIVTDIAGTTRDTIEETAQIKGIPFQLVDTAGILEPRDLVEKEAIKRSHVYIDSADLILFVIDNHQGLSKEDEIIVSKVKNKNVLVVVNKCDLKSKFNKEKIQKTFKGKKIIEVSALKKMGMEKLETAIVQNVWHGKVMDTPRVMVSNIRHVNALKNCFLILEKIKQSSSKNLPFEILTEDIKTAVNYLDSITGRNIDSDLIDKIFSEFCIGK
jgi:tRNA modification GTPase